MKENPVYAAFIRELRKVLPNLYNPGQVRRSPLVRLFDLDRRRDSPSALQHLICEAIESLEPDEDKRVGPSAWRVYQVLHGRYVDQFAQDEVARDMFLSSRQLRRLEQEAVEVLADQLWNGNNLEARAGLLMEAEESENSAASIGRGGNLEKRDEVESGPSGRNEELAWLERTLSSQEVDCAQLVRSILQVSQPLIDSLHTQVTFLPEENLPLLSIQATTMRQALLNLITLAARRAGDGRVDIRAEALPNMLYVRLQISVPSSDRSHVDGLAEDESLEVARKLIQLSMGSCEIEKEDPNGGRPVFRALITLPTAEQVPVLVIDDNIDTLSLVERYLSGTRYRFQGAAQPAEALEIVARAAPGVILLDVMLPEIDGWDLLGRLRTHPATQNIPIIVCTILPQAQLALMLGAADFLSKPIRREALLLTLDHLVGPASTKSG